MTIQIGLNKGGNKLQISTKKADKFVIDLWWDSQNDVDSHALLCTNGKITKLEELLSTYNTKKNNPNGLCITNSNGSFSTPCGSLTHSGDTRDGTNTDIDETITVDGSKIPAGVNEIPIFVIVHDLCSFEKVKDCGIKISSGGKIIAEYKLSKEFGKFRAVQFGTIKLSNNGWEFEPVGAGFDGDMNTVLGQFS